MKTLVYQFSLGEHEGFVLNDHSSAHTADELIVNPNYEELEQFTQEFSFKLEEIPVDYNNLLIRVGNQNTLVDAGIPRPEGDLFLSLEKIGIDPGDIDTIIITHSDLDHVGGIVDEAGEISFPNAKYVMLDDSWQYWSSEKRRAELTNLNKWTQDRTQSVWEIFSRIEALMLFVKPGEEFMPGFQLFPAPGHRYDHVVLRVTSAGEQFMHMADAIVHPLFMAERDWCSTYDAHPVQAVETKTRLLDICASENALVFGAHFPFPGLGYVQQEGGRWKWRPIYEA